MYAGIGIIAGGSNDNLAWPIILNEFVYGVVKFGATVMRTLVGPETEIHHSWLTQLVGLFEYILHPVDNACREHVRAQRIIVRCSLNNAQIRLWRKALVLTNQARDKPLPVPGRYSCYRCSVA